jgi:hypothetical protein
MALTGLLDTGSTDMVMDLHVALAIGARLGSPQGTVTWRGNKYPRQVAEVEFELARGGTVWRWKSRVVFTRAPLGYMLLGDRGFLQYMDARFLGHDRFAELETNTSYSGEVRRVVS